MLKQDVNIYKEVQKNAEVAMKTIDVLSNKIFNEQLAIQASKQSAEYSEIRNRAYDKLIEAKAEPYRSSYLENAVLTGGINYNTLFNTSTSKIAELLIKGSNSDVVNLRKAINHNGGAGEMAKGLAQELINLEGKNIERLNKYL